jgi:uncharacterized phiE125 gp8 family phage protein
MSFIQPPFWSQPSRSTAPHAVSVLFTAPVLEPLTLVQAKLRAGLDWTDGDPRDALMNGFIAAARSKVEQDTGLALLTQTRDIYFDALPGSIIDLPPQSRPLQSVTSIKSTDTAGAVQTLDPTAYVVDLNTARIGLALGQAWPSDLRPFQPWAIRIVSGYTSAALIPPLLVHAVGLLVAHYATIGRDAVQIGHIVATTPYGYDDAIAPYRLESVA